MRKRNKGTPGNETEKKSIVRGRTRRSARTNKSAGRGRGSQRTRSRASRVTSSNPSSPSPAAARVDISSTSPPAARVDIPLRSLMAQEGQASPTQKRKFKVVPPTVSKRPLKSVRTKSPKTPLNQDDSKVLPKKLSMPQEPDKSADIDTSAIKKKPTVDSDVKAHSQESDKTADIDSSAIKKKTTVDSDVKAPPSIEQTKPKEQEPVPEKNKTQASEKTNHNANIDSTSTKETVKIVNKDSSSIKKILSVNTDIKAHVSTKKLKSKEPAQKTNESGVSGETVSSSSSTKSNASSNIENKIKAKVEESEDQKESTSIDSTKDILKKVPSILPKTTIKNMSSTNKKEDELDVNDMREVEVKDFFPEKEQCIVFSVLSLLPYANDLKKFASRLFDMHNDPTSNWVISDDQEKELLNYLTQKLLQKEINNISKKEEEAIVFEYIGGRLSQVEHSSSIRLTMKSMLRLCGKSNAGWIGDEIIDFVSDIINLCTGVHNYQQS